jgi:hypothetical protein
MDSELPESPTSPPRRKRNPGGPVGRPPSMSETSFSNIGETPASEVPYIAQDDLNKLLADNRVGFAGFESEQDTMPPELAEFMEVNAGLTSKNFTIMLKRRAKGAISGTDAANTFVDSFFRTVPSMRYIMLEYGPGDYEFNVQWREQFDNPESGKREQKHKHEIIPFAIDDSCELQYLEHQRDKRLKTQIRLREKAKRAREDNKMDLDVFGADTAAPQADPRASAKEYVREIVDVARELGLTRQENAGGGLMDTLAKMAPLLLPLVQGMMDRQSAQQAQMQTQLNTMITLLLSQSKESSMQLVEFAKQSANKNSGADQFKEIRDMIFGAIDIKDAISGHGKETVSDRIFGVIEGVLPQFLQLMSMNQVQRQLDPRFHMAKAYVATNPDIQKALNDPAIMEETVNKLDAYFGWRQTDGILTVMGVKRPETCPHDPAMELPHDERPQPVENAEEVVDGQPNETGTVPEGGA